MRTDRISIKDIQLVWKALEAFKQCLISYLKQPLETAWFQLAMKMSLLPIWDFSHKTPHIA
jgi:hypothetical protein